MQGEDIDDVVYVSGLGELLRQLLLVFEGNKAVLLCLKAAQLIKVTVGQSLLQ